jgi:hypothetical protein
MPNSTSLSHSPLKRKTFTLTQSTPSSVATPYKERLIHSGLVTSVVTVQGGRTTITSEGNPIPAISPIDSSGELKPPPTSLPHINPYALGYPVKIIAIDEQVYNAQVYLAKNIGQDFSLELDVAIPEEWIEGARWDIYYPMDDGIRYASTISAISQDNLVFTGEANSVDKGLDTVDTTIGVPSAAFPDHNLITISVSSGDIQVRTLTFLNRIGDPALFTVDSEFTTLPEVGDIIIVTSAKWTGFCNPIYNPYLSQNDLKTFLTTSTPDLPDPLEGGPDKELNIKDPLYDSDVTIGDSNAVQYPVFDYELEYETGIITWYGNSVMGLKGLDVTPNVDLVSGEYSTVTPLIPYNSKLGWKGTVLGSTNFVTESQAFTLTEAQEASVLHHHGNLYTKTINRYHNTTLEIGTINSYTDANILHVSKSDIDRWNENSLWNFLKFYTITTTAGGWSTVSLIDPVNDNKIIVYGSQLLILGSIQTSSLSGGVLIKFDPGFDFNINLRATIAGGGGGGSGGKAYANSQAGSTAETGGSSTLYTQTAGGTNSVLVLTGTGGSGGLGAGLTGNDGSVGSSGILNVPLDNTKEIVFFGGSGGDGTSGTTGQDGNFAVGGSGGLGSSSISTIGFSGSQGAAGGFGQPGGAGGLGGGLYDPIFSQSSIESGFDAAILSKAGLKGGNGASNGHNNLSAGGGGGGGQDGYLYLELL